MNEKHDIENLDDIKVLVDEFYGKVRTDEYLSPLFRERLGDDWQPHLQKMYAFWEAILLQGKGYAGNPFQPHRTLPIRQIHFEVWVRLFSDAVLEHFKGPNAEMAIWRANKMAEVFAFKLAYEKEFGS